MRRLRYSCPFFALRAASLPATLTDVWLARQLFGPDVISPRTSYGCMVPPGSEAGPASVHKRIHTRPTERTHRSDRTPKAYPHKLSRSNRTQKTHPYKTPRSNRAPNAYLLRERLDDTPDGVSSNLDIDHVAQQHGL